MKKIIKTIFGMVAVICIAFAFAECVDLGRSVLSDEEVFNTKISSTLDREEHRNTIKREYNGKFKSNPYKYISIKNVISYVNKITKEVLAEFTVVMQFKYNEKTKESECIGTSYGSMSKDTDYSVSISARKANNTTREGAGIADIEFKYRGEARDKFSRRISCDYLGNIDVSDC